MMPNSRPVSASARVLVNRAARKRAECKRDTEIDSAGSDGSDDRLQSAVDHNRPVKGAADKPHCEYCDDTQRCFQRVAMDDPRGQAVGQDERHSNRQVYAGGDHNEGLRHRNEREKHALVGRCLHNIRGEACRMVAHIDDEHHDEDAECQQRAALFG